MELEIKCDKCKGLGYVPTPAKQRMLPCQTDPCYHCNRKGYIITEFGQKLIDFLDRHYEVKVNVSTERS